MSFLLDTCLLSELIKPVPDEGVLAWMRGAATESCHLSVVSIGEISRGIARLPAGRRRSGLSEWLDGLESLYSDRIIEINRNIARRWGAVSGTLDRRGRSMSMADGLIAVSALEHGLTVVTRNVQDFEPFGLRPLNPWLPAKRK